VLKRDNDGNITLPHGHIPPADFETERVDKEKNKK
jgi:hypothetical protein